MLNCSELIYPEWGCEVEFQVIHFALSLALATELCLICPTSFLEAPDSLLMTDTPRHELLHNWSVSATQPKCGKPTPLLACAALSWTTTLTDWMFQCSTAWLIFMAIFSPVWHSGISEVHSTLVHDLLMKRAVSVM